MATLLDLIRRAPPPLHRLDPGFDDGTQEFRSIVCSPRLKAWIDQDLSALKSALGIELSPQEQFFALVQTFCSDEPLTYGEQFKPLYCRGRGVWELKTSDLRVFGWFPMKDHFVGVAGNDATFIKEHSLYQGYIEEVVRFRDALDLDEPKFIPGEEARDVVSNYNFA